LPVGARLLDCPSGQARHARLFAAAGLSVTALDYSDALLNEARRAGGLDGVRLVRGDMRRLPRAWSARFDGIASLGASFGLLPTPADDEACIASFARVLKPGGALVLHAANRDGIVARFIGRDWWESDEGVLVLHEREFDPLSGVLTVRTTLQRRGRARRRAYRMRLYTPSEVAAMCARHGLLVVGAFDAWRDRAVRRTSGEVLVHCVKSLR
jgi:ubiquinone/menaquinone biosynthesis C-methylase UbiE